MKQSNHTLNNKIVVFIGSDHGGYKMKQDIQNDPELKKMIDFHDVGTHSEESVDYPDYAEKIADAVLKNKGSYGIGICGTGIGICIALNKFKGIYAANINKIEEAKLAKEHNNANVITLSGRFTSLSDNIELIKTFLNDKFESGRHMQRIEKIKEIENKQ